MVTEKEEVDCDECKNIFITEFQQKAYNRDSGKVLPHRCVKYNKRLFHRNVHPKIVPCLDCDGMEFVKR